MHRRPRRSSLVALLLTGPLLVTGCSAGSLGSSDGGGGKKTSIVFLVDNGDASVKPAQALVKAFEKDHPDVAVDVQTRPGGTDGDNLVKTRLATGSMNEVFLYNSGSLFQQIAPAKNLAPLTDDTFVSRVDKAFLPQVSAGKDVYGVPFGTAFGGGVLYNKEVYSTLGLSVPKTWDQLIKNSEAIKAAGIAPVIQTYKDTFTSQLLVLADFHNVAASDPQFAEKYTKNKAKFATTPAALAGFQHLQQVHDMGLENSDFASTSLNDGLKMLTEGKGAQLPMLSGAVTIIEQQTPDAIDKIGFFALPGADAATNGMTAWFPNALYIPASTSGAKLKAAKEFLDFVVSPKSCDAQSSAGTPTGPYPIKGCTLPKDVPPAVKDVAAYFDSGKQSPALEFLSPVKGPSLEQICVEVGSGIRPAEDGAALYDQDVQKQAQQLGLPGW